MPKAVVDFSGPIEHQRKALKGGSPLRKMIGALVIEQIGDRFDREGDPGNMWPELSPATKKEKARKGLSPKKLERTGNFQNSFFFRDEGDRTIIFGAPNPGAKMVHQEGFDGTVSVKAYTKRIRRKVAVRTKAGKIKKTKKGKIKKVAKVVVQKVKAHIRKMKIPARPPMRFTDDNLNDIVELIKENAV